jgi:hypothetical protein
MRRVISLSSKQRRKKLQGILERRGRWEQGHKLDQYCKTILFQHLVRAVRRHLVEQPQGGNGTNSNALNASRRGNNMNQPTDAQSSPAIVRQRHDGSRGLLSGTSNR